MPTRYMNRDSFKFDYSVLRYGKPFSSTSYTYGESAGYFLGSNQTLVPVASGTFVPGVMRINDVLISTRMAKTEPVDVLTQSTGIWNYQLVGQALLTKDPYANDSFNDGQAKEAWVKAAAKATETPFDAAVFLAELGETIALLRNPTAGLVKNLNKLNRRRSDPEMLKILGDMSSDLWLTFIYGIKPIMLDVESLMELYRKGIKKQLRLFRKKAKVENRTLTSSVRNGTTVQSFVPRVSETIEVKQFSVANVYYQHLLQQDMAWIAQQFGFSLQNLPAVFWERVTYSFLVDWFFRVGDWLKAITPDPSLNYLDSCVSQRTSIKVEVQPLSWQHISVQPTVVRQPGSYVFTLETLRRKKMVDKVLFPPINSNMLSLTKQITAAALSWQQATNLLRRLHK